MTITLTNGKEDYVDVKAIATHLDCAESFVYKLIKGKKIPYYKIGRKYLLKLSEVEGDLEKHYRYA